MALNLDKVKIGEHKMRVSPSKQNSHLMPFKCHENQPEDPLNTSTLQISGVLPIELIKNKAIKLRQILARFGKIWYFDIVRDE